MYKAVIIGTGAIANAHVVGARDNADRLELVAGMDIDETRVKEFCANNDIPNWYTDVGTMLETEKPDLVLICTPPSTHKDQCIQSLEAGAWVLCEKPLCASLAEFDAITEAEERTGGYVASIFQQRFGAAAQHVRRLIEEKAMGDPTVGLCETMWYRDDAYYAVPWRGKWSTEVGGTTMTHGIHVMDLMLYLLGPWAEVRSMMGTLQHDIEVDDAMLGVIKMENGALMNVISSAVSPRQETYLRLDFQKATVELRYLYRYGNADWQFSIPDGATNTDELAVWQNIDGDWPSSHTAQIRAFLDAKDKGERPAVGGETSRNTLEFCTALYKAAMTGQPVTRGSIAEGDPFYYTMSGQPQEQTPA